VAYKNKTLEMVTKDFKSSWDYCVGSWHARWQNNHYLYNNQRVKRGYDGITDTFVPMTFSTVETMASALFGTKPKFDYLPPRDKPDQKTDILNALLDHYWDKDQWSLKIINTGKGMLKLGTSVDYFAWDRDHPVLINVPIRDFFIDPMATSLDNARYMGRRFLTTKKDLETFEVVDLDAEPDENGDYPMKKKYSNLNKVKPGKTEENTDKQEKDIWYGSTIAEPEKEQVEVIEYWTEDKVVSVANREIVIEDNENYFKAKDRANGNKFPRGILPFADARDYMDESLFYAKGEIDFILDEQELLNDITNQNVDAVTFALNPMYALKPEYAHLINEIENLPGAVYPVPPDALQPIVMATVPASAFNERQNLKNEIRETTASNEVVKGAPTQGSNTTATEINAQIAGAGQRINLKVTQIENGYFHRMAKIVFAMIKLYVTEPMMVRIMGKDGAKWEQFDPSEFQGDYEPRVQLDVTIQNKKQLQANQAKDMIAAYMNNPVINQEELAKLTLQRAFDLDPDEVAALVQPQAPPMAPGMGAPTPGMPPSPQDALAALSGAPSPVPAAPVGAGL
jgi:hypothetical protein